MLPSQRRSLHLSGSRATQKARLSRASLPPPTLSPHESWTRNWTLASRRVNAKLAMTTASTLRHYSKAPAHDSQRSREKAVCNTEEVTRVIALDTAVARGELRQSLLSTQMNFYIDSCGPRILHPSSWLPQYQHFPQLLTGLAIHLLG